MRARPSPIIGMVTLGIQLLLFTAMVTYIGLWVAEWTAPQKVQDRIEPLQGQQESPSWHVPSQNRTIIFKIGAVDEH